jgi:cysteinyl-tRNA synthetase
MSKSLGNSLVVADVLLRARPQAVRYFLGSAHYRSDLDWSEDALADADAAYRRIENFLTNAADHFRACPVPTDSPRSGPESLPGAFTEAMDDDLGVPRALGVLHETVRAGNTALADGEREALVAAYRAAVAMLDVLGLAPEDFATAGGEDARLRGALDALVPVLLESRQAARERKDWAAADRFRDALAAAGIAVEDTADGARWRLS